MLTGLQSGTCIQWKNYSYPSKIETGKRQRPQRAEILQRLGYGFHPIAREMKAKIQTEPAGRVEDFQVPLVVRKVHGDSTVPIGDVILSTIGMSIGIHFFDELCMQKPPQCSTARDGASVHIVSAASCHTLGGIRDRFSTLKQTAETSGGVILYANQRGCDGNRSYYDACPMVFAQGELVAQGSQFLLQDVEVLIAVLDVDAAEASRASQDDAIDFFGLKSYRCITLGRDLAFDHGADAYCPFNKPKAFRSYSSDEEIAMGPACWLWDYLRRSNAGGVFVPLSGGMDSCSTAMIVFSMCRLLLDAIQNGNRQVQADVRSVTREREWLPKTPQELCHRILHTAYMGVSGHSSTVTRDRAQNLTRDIGAYHIDMSIDSIFEAQKQLSLLYLNHLPAFENHVPMDNIALQNIQARLRMVTAYYFAQLLPRLRARPHDDKLLVLSSVNVEECLRGDLTKHDCSSADLSLIGSFTKQELAGFLCWARVSFDLPILDNFLAATPTAELEPLSSGWCGRKETGIRQQDMRYFAEMRKDSRLGAFSMFQHKLLHSKDQRSPDEKAELVRKLHLYYQENRHKMSTVTPAYRGGKFDPNDDRPILYPAFDKSWTDKRIKQMVHRRV